MAPLRRAEPHERSEAGPGEGAAGGPKRANPAQLIRAVIQAYDPGVARAYCTIRFRILRQRFLFEIGQYLPDRGTVLDIGCGFGLFGLFFALQSPGLHIRGLDLNPRRIEMARRAAERLHATNVTFEVGDASLLQLDEPLTAAYMLDLIHHIPAASVERLIRHIAGNLQPGGLLLIKDVDTSPAYKLAFTWLLDKLVDYRAPVRYWAPREIQRLLESVDLQVRRHSMLDLLPYPHVLYINTRPLLERSVTGPQHSQDHQPTPVTSRAS